MTPQSSTRAQHKNRPPSRIVLAGNFPPPVHGMASVNAAVLARLLERNTQPLALDTSPPKASGGSIARLRRAFAMMRVLGGLVHAGRLAGGTFYLSVSGGWGQVYDILMVATARWLGRTILLHHHSFAYLDRHSAIASLLVRAAGRDGCHVVLCNRMGDALRDRYHPLAKIIVVSNAAFVDAPVDNSPSRKQLSRIGFLANISEEKGIFRFLDVAQTMLDYDKTLTAVIAGNFESASLRRLVLKRISQSPNVQYIGAVYGKEKAGFFSRIDVLLFPSAYRNEAEPLTIYEALAAGVPVIATARGCVAEMLASSEARPVDRPEEFVKEATHQLNSWISNPVSFSRASVEAKSQYSAAHNSAQAPVNHLLDLIAGGPAP